MGKVKNIGTFFRYPGGKTKLRDQIINRLLECSVGRVSEYREPFFGGGAIGLNLLFNNPTKFDKVWINDKDVGIACLWTSVLEYPNELKSRVNDFSPNVDSFHKLKEELPSILDFPQSPEGVVDVGFKKLAIHQISYSGLGTMSGGPLGGKKQESKYKIDCRWSPNRICSKVDAFSKKFKAFNVYDNRCTCSDFEELIDGDGALLYLDPPYYVEGNNLYQCGFTQKDHERLSASLRSTGNRWVLSYDACDEIHQLYDWAHIDILEVCYTITGSRDKVTKKVSGRHKTELLIYN